MKTAARIVVVVTLAMSMVVPLADAETITIYRDDFGIPHIYAETAEGGLYAQGWAMAEDGLERTLENYLRGLGKFSAAYGAGENDANVRADLEVSRHIFHAEPSYVIRDPISFASNRLRPEEYEVFVSFDGKRTLAEIYDELDRLGTREVEAETYRPRIDLFFWPLAGFLVGMLALHAGMLLVSARRAREFAHG